MEMIEALFALQAALKDASECGLLDELASSYSSSEIVNEFVDAVAAMATDAAHEPN